MKNNQNTFKAQTIKIPYENDDELYHKATNAKKKSILFSDMFFNITKWFSNKLKGMFTALFDSISAFVSAQTNVVIDYFGVATIRQDVYEIALKQERMQVQIDFLLQAFQEHENNMKKLKKEMADLEKLVEKLEQLSHIKYSSTDDEMLTADSPDMSLTDIPAAIVCPITQQIFINPVTIKLRQPDGTFCHKTYERKAIVEWKNRCQRSGRNFHDPLTRLPVVNDPENLPIDEIKKEMARQFVAGYSAKPVTTTLWQTKKSETVAPVQSYGGVRLDI